MLAVGLDEEIIGWDEPVFLKAKKQILGALISALALLDELPDQKGSATAPAALSNKVFVVYGHDEKAKTALEIMLREMGLMPHKRMRVPRISRVSPSTTDVCPDKSRKPPDRASPDSKPPISPNISATRFIIWSSIARRS
jgi:hypothetical protein